MFDPGDAQNSTANQRKGMAHLLTSYPILHSIQKSLSCQCPICNRGRRNVRAQYGDCWPRRGTPLDIEICFSYWLSVPLCRCCCAFTILHHWMMISLAQRIRSLVCTTAAHCLATSRATVRRWSSRCARTRRHLFCKTVAARARLVAERNREQRNVSAPSVKSLSRICDLEEPGEMRYASDC